MKLFSRKFLFNLLVFLIAFFALFSAKFPSLYLYYKTPPGLFYGSQASWFDAWDNNVYVSYIRYGQNHGMLLENYYTLIPHKGVLVFQVYTFLGVVNRFLKTDSFLLFHLAALFSGTLLLLAVYFAVSKMFETGINRLAAFTIISLGGGLGFIRQFHRAADYNLAGFTLTDALERPHDALISLFVILIVINLGMYLFSKKISYLRFSGIYSFLAFVIHPPLGLFSLVLYSYCFYIFRKNSYTGKNMAFLFLLLIIELIYFLFIFLPFMKSPGFKNIGELTHRPDVSELILGFGFLTFGIVASFLYKSQNFLINFIQIAFVLQLLLLFSPFPFNLYYVRGIFVWGVFLAVSGFTAVIVKKYLTYFLILLVLISLPLKFLVFSTLIHPDLYNQFVFLDKKEGDSLKFLNAIPAGSGVLSLYRIGNYIPAFTDNKVYLGHIHQTPDFKGKLKSAELFYLNTNIKTMDLFLKENRIGYVYFGVEENLIRKNNGLPYFTGNGILKQVFSNGPTSVFYFPGS